MIEAAITGFVIVFGIVMGSMMLAGEVLLWKEIPGWRPRAHLARMMAIPIYLILLPCFADSLGRQEAP
jgi:hypothetical protein